MFDWLLLVESIQVFNLPLDERVKLRRYCFDPGFTRFPSPSLLFSTRNIPVRINYENRIHNYYSIPCNPHWDARERQQIHWLESRDFQSRLKRVICYSFAYTLNAPGGKQNNSEYRKQVNNSMKCKFVLALEGETRERESLMLAFVLAPYHQPNVLSCYVWYSIQM